LIGLTGNLVHRRKNLASLLLRHNLIFFSQDRFGIQSPESKGDDCMNIEEFKKELEERLLNFAVACVNISKELPRNSKALKLESKL